MKIVADKNIPFVREAFSTFGELVMLGSTEIAPGNLRSADILIIRSETPVNRTLLEGSRVQFVATVTIGTDHIDTDYLESRGIAYASAPGSNANSVKEYVVAALLELATTKGISLKGKTLGVVGVGNIGSKVVKAARGLGMEVLENDPPLAHLTGDRRYLPLDRLMDCDAISLHVPLTKTGLDPTFHLFDAARFRAMKPGTLFMNTSRGAVVETAPLIDAIRSQRLGASVIDVWENEPVINSELLSLVTICSAHIAGYSMDGKVRAVGLAREAVRRHVKAGEDLWDPFALLGAPAVSRVQVPDHAAMPEEVFHAAVTSCYDIRVDDALLRQQLSLESAGERSAHFRHLRASYRLRREFTTVELPRKFASLAEPFCAIGFQCVIHNGERTAWPRH